MTERKKTMDLVTKNWSAILQVMKRLGATGAVVEYRGSGDSGEGVEVTVQPEGIDLTTQVEMFTVHSEFQSGAWVRTEVGSQMSCEDALKWLTDEVVSLAGHDGYETGEGGYGQLHVCVAEERFELDHSDYVVETVDSNHSIEDLLGSDEEVPTLPPQLPPALEAPLGASGA